MIADLEQDLPLFYLRHCNFFWKWITGYQILRYLSNLQNFLKNSNMKLSTCLCSKINRKDKFLFHHYVYFWKGFWSDHADFHFEYPDPQMIISNPEHCLYGEWALITEEGCPERLDPAVLKYLESCSGTNIASGTHHYLSLQLQNQSDQDPYQPRNYCRVCFNS